MVTRKEERYLFESSKIKEFLKEIDPIIGLKVFPTNYNQTVYFNNAEHEVPFGVSIKARRYISSPWEQHFQLYPDEEWILEIKKDLVIKNSRLRKKERENLKLKEILKTLQNKLPITSPLRTYVADDYRRRHYSINGEDEFRITIDDELKYYFFESGFDGVQIGKEDYSRMEIKVPQDKLNSLEFQLIKKLLQDLEAEPIISKKDAAYNLLSKYLRKKSNRHVQSSDTEIEAKLLLNKEDQQVFHKIKNDFYNGNIDGFNVLESFPHTLEGGKLHRYIITPDHGCLRFSMKGKSKKVTIKKDTEIINDPFGLNCIIKRSETKKPFSSDLLALPSKMLYRKRKYFIVENKESGNSYCILIDRCTHNNNELFQMEVEGLLLSPSENEEKEIIKDIAYITNQMVKKYRVLRPTTVSKLDWLKEV